MKIAITIPLILLLTSCAHRSDYRPSLTDDGTVIDIKLGQQFQITLDSNPTTGYQWRYSEDPEGVVKLVSHDYSSSTTITLSP